MGGGNCRENPANNPELVFKEKGKTRGSEEMVCFEPSHISPVERLPLSALPRDVQKGSGLPPKTQKDEPKPCLRHTEFNPTVTSALLLSVTELD